MNSSFSDSKKRLREYDDKQRAVFKPKSTQNLRNMPSSKGEPTDPELREKIKEEVKNEEKGIFEILIFKCDHIPCCNIWRFW